ncbi:uncharacterized protein LOC115367846 [Myripristis murdjan]|uniref:uncharacterized protein LOC115367846 n=1 Tax=Myripristis murdjan TaxID=586833 RepID=UPI001175CBDD|nr:uncharacterized protein LOC115367846 [Myripristis murdjan]
MAGKVVSGAVGLAGLVVRGAPMADGMLSENLSKLSLSSGSPSQDEEPNQQESNQEKRGTEDKDSSGGLVVRGAPMADGMLSENLSKLSLSSGSPSQDEEPNQQESNQEKRGTEDKDSSGGLVVRGAPMADGMLSENLSKLSLSSGSPSQDEEPNQQKRGHEEISSSSKLANKVNAGGAGRYKDLINRRLHERDDCFKGCMEADHIPPVDSWETVRQHPEFDSLKYINPALYEMACSLENDRKGRNLLAIEVPTQCHRVNLTTGNSTESRSVRALLADYIARGEAERMLKLAFIVAHPHTSNKIRKDAGLPKKEFKKKCKKDCEKDCEKECGVIIEFTKERIRKIYKKGFLELLELYHEKKVINQEELERLTEFVESDRFLQRESDEYQEILTNVLECLERRNQS